MIMADLKTNYVDDVLDTTKNQLRKYQQIQNDDGTVSFVDVTEYTQVGTSFGAKDINDTNAAINDVNGKLDKNEHGTYTYDPVSTTNNIEISIKFKNTHKVRPNVILVSYRTFGYFYGELHVIDDSQTATGFKCIYIPKNIGNGKGRLIIDWVAFWD